MVLRSWLGLGLGAAATDDCDHICLQWRQPPCNTWAKDARPVSGAVQLTGAGPRGCCYRRLY